MNRLQLLTGITKDGCLYFLEIQDPTQKHNYFSMSGFTVKPLKYEDAVEMNREMLEDDSSYWKQAVEAGSTELGFKDWVQHVINTDGETSLIDTSLFPQEYEVEGETWIFESESCGQHVERELEKYHIPEKYFKMLLNVWDKNHLKPEAPITTQRIHEDMKPEVLKRSRDKFIIDYIKTLS